MTKTEKMTYRLGKRSRSNLAGVNADLVGVVEQAITLTEVDFAVIEGVRTVERQRILVDRGASRTMNSYHITGHAVDLAAFIGRELRWDWPLYYKIADAMKEAARQQKVKLTWGGDWKRFKDGPHFQVKRPR